MRSLLIAILMVIVAAGSSFATTPVTPASGTSTSTATATATNANTITNNSSATGGAGGSANVTNKNSNSQSQGQSQSNKQSQNQGQLQGQGQGQSQSADNAGNSQDLSVSSPHQAPAFGVYASGPCSGVSFAVSTVLGGGGIGFTDGECSKREAVRTFMMLGLRDDAIHIAKSLSAYTDLHNADGSNKVAVADASIPSAASHEFGQ